MSNSDFENIERISADKFMGCMGRDKKDEETKLQISEARSESRSSASGELPKVALDLMRDLDSKSTSKKAKRDLGSNKQVDFYAYDTVKLPLRLEAVSDFKTTETAEDLLGSRRCKKRGATSALFQQSTARPGVTSGLTRTGSPLKQQLIDAGWIHKDGTIVGVSLGRASKRHKTQYSKSASSQENEGQLSDELKMIGSDSPSLQALIDTPWRRSNDKDLSRMSSLFSRVKAVLPDSRGDAKESDSTITKTDGGHYENSFLKS